MFTVIWEIDILMQLRNANIVLNCEPYLFFICTVKLVVVLCVHMSNSNLRMLLSFFSPSPLCLSLLLPGLVNALWILFHPLHYPSFQPSWRDAWNSPENNFRYSVHPLRYNWFYLYLMLALLSQKCWLNKFSSLIHRFFRVVQIYYHIKLGY